MTKKTRLIPFEYEKAIYGAKIIYRDGSYPDEIIFPNKASHSSTCVISVLGQIYTHFKDGYCNIQKSECARDLFIEEELDERTFYVNVYKGSHSQTYETLDIAKDACCGKSCLGQLKVTYTDEDLIK